VLRLGCLGCLTALVLAALAVAVVWGAFQITRAPEIARPPTTPTDGLRAQQKIFDVMRAAGDHRPHGASLDEREVNAFLSRHLSESRDLPLRHLAVRLLGDGRLELAGQLPLRHLLTAPPFSALTAIVPGFWLEHEVWLAVRARVTLDGTGGALEPRRRLRLDVERFWLGRLRLPELMLRILLDPGALRLLRWPVPDAFDEIRIEPGRLVIHAGS